MNRSQLLVASTACLLLVVGGWNGVASQSDTGDDGSGEIEGKTNPPTKPSGEGSGGSGRGSGGSGRGSGGSSSGGSSGGSGDLTDKCLNCICQIESQCDPNIGCKWDVGSYSCGPYQIKENYWIDCGKLGSGWKSCANDMTCATNCVRKYMARYGSRCTGGRAPTCQDFARIHNGGPGGCKSPKTVGYWNKVEKCCGSQTGCD